MGDRKPLDEVLAEEAATNAALNSPQTLALLQAMQRQMLIVLVNRLGGSVRVPVAEVDGTGPFVLSIGVEGTDFIFSVLGKN